MSLEFERFKTFFPEMTMTHPQFDALKEMATYQVSSVLKSNDYALGLLICHIKISREDPESGRITQKSSGAISKSFNPALTSWLEETTYGREYKALLKKQSVCTPIWVP